MSCEVCKKGSVENECTNCKMQLCSDPSCGTSTVDGYLCGEYTQWGCSRKYTTCDICLEDAAIHESDLNFCDDCGDAMCDDCAADLEECEACSSRFCEECMKEHECE